MSGACSLIGSPAGNIVQDGWSKYSSKADQTFADAQRFTTELKEFITKSVETSVVNVDYSWNLNSTLLSGYNRPTDYTPQEVPVPADETLSPITQKGITGISVGNIPDFAEQAPHIDSSGLPDKLTATPPDRIPAETEIHIPDSPNLVIPPVPSLRQLDLSPFASLTLPEFIAQDPTINLNAPTSAFSWNETEYSSATLDKVKAEISRMLDGGTGIPAVIWEAIWEREGESEREAAQRLNQEVREAWGLNGWAAPGGVVGAQIQKANESVLRGSQARRREKAVAQAQMEVENLRHAVVQGIALETVLTQLHSGRMQRALQAAEFVSQLGINLYNASVAGLQAQVAKQRTDVAVFAERLKAALVPLEVRKLELEEAKTKGTLNTQDIEVYKGQLAAVEQQVRNYTAQLQGVQALVDIDKNKVARFGEQVRAYQAQVQAKTTEYQGYEAKMRGQLGAVQAFQAAASAYAAQIQGYNAKANIERARMDGDIAIARFDIEQLRADAERIRANAQVAAARASAIAQSNDAMARKYEADGRIEQYKAETNLKQYSAALAELQARQELELKKAEINIQQIQRQLELESREYETLLKVKSELSASLYAAFNLGATSSDRVSNSTQCSTTYSL